MEYDFFPFLLLNPITLPKVSFKTIYTGLLSIENDVLRKKMTAFKF